MNKKEYNQISLELIKELQTPLAGSIEPYQYKKLQVDTMVEFLDLILDEYENDKQTLDKKKKS